jgi:tellurite resistance protein TerC
VIFASFGVPRLYQHRVLFWGILGVIVLRALMIGLGAAMVAEAGWVLYIFAAFLIFTGVKLLFAGDQPQDIGSNRLLNWVKRHCNVTATLHGERFLVRQADAKGRRRWFMTPLLLALLTIEVADVVFAVDSVPAIFAITTDPFIVYTSNIFAILGLRALYFALAAMVDRFHYLKYALAAVLVFIGGKIFAADMLGIAKIPPAVSLGVTVSLLAAGFLYSLWKTRGTAAARRS